MNNKLKMLFSYFRGLKTKTLDTDIIFDVNTLEEWDEKFYYNKNDGQRAVIKPPDVIISVFNDIIKTIRPEFNKYNYYEFSELWHLNIDIYPFENKMVFTSDCNVEKEKKLKSVTYVEDINFTPKSKNYLNEIFDEGIIKKLEIEFYGRWDDGQVKSVLVNDINTRLDGEDEEKYWNIVNDVMIDLQGRWWNGENGVSGEIIIYSNDKVVIDCIEYYEEYENTDMNIEITLNSFNDEL